MPVNAYDVEGEVDYQKLVKEFGASLIDESILKSSFKSQLLGDYFYAHRDFDKILKEKKFAVVSGRGVSASMHLGHLITFKFVKELQDHFGCKVIIPFSDDEKYLYKQDLSFEKVQEYTKENLMDLLALDFDMKNTEFIFDTFDLKQDVYNLSLKCAKRMTGSMVKSSFGFDDSKNIGTTFYPAMQAAHILYPTVKYGLPVVVPVGIDQDVFIKLARDVAFKLKLQKPAALLSKFFPGLDGNPKMSASKKETSIYTTDDPKKAKKKIMRAFTGGRESLEEQKKKGGNPDICPLYKYEKLFFTGKKETEKIYKNCKAGKLLCGEHKKILADKVENFLIEHQKKREKSKKQAEKLLNI